MSTLIQPHIEKDAQGRPIISGTTTKVSEIVLDRLAYHWDADEMQRQHPHLGLAQIHSALAYYYDHREEIESEIEQAERMAEDLRDKLESPTLLHKLLAARPAK